MGADESGEPPVGGSALPPPFEIAYRGNHVELVLHARGASTPPVDAAAVHEALQRTPLRIINRDLVDRTLTQHGDGGAELRVNVGQVVPPVSDAPCAIVVSRDAMAAYIVPSAPAQRPKTAAKPPSDPVSPEAAAPSDGAGATVPEGAAALDGLVTTEMLRQLLSSAGVTTGILDDVIDAFGEGQPLTDIRAVAHGIAAVPPVDTTVTHHFDTTAHAAPVEREDGTMDYHAAAVQRFIAAETVLATLTPGSLGVPGTDVYGKSIGVPAIREIAIEKISGEHTTVRDHDVIAEIAGRPVLTAQDVITVLPVFEVRGDLNYGVGNIDSPGDVVIQGDVKPGFAITAGGAVIIRGLVEGASITAGGDLTVTGTVGEHKTTFEVGGNLTARYLHTTDATVQGTVQVTGEIVNCTITAERVTTGSQGRIVGGSVSARTEIDTGSLGARQGVSTHIAITDNEPGVAARARRATYPGVVIQIGRATRAIAQELPAASFWEAGSSVIALRVTADETAVAAARSAPQDAA